MSCPKRNATSTNGWIRITCCFIITAPCCFAWVHSYSSIVYPRRKHPRSSLYVPYKYSQSTSSCYSSLQQEDNPSQPSSSSPEQLDSKKESLNDILKELNQQFNYEGRLPSDYSPLDSKVSTPNTTTTIPFRCGFVALVGAPNMGKSSLVNALLEEELCITTHRPQTTRHAILAILNAPPQLKCQLCFLDTPGVIDQPAYKLQQGMMEAVQGAFQDADVLLLVTDIFSTPIPNDALFQRVVYLSKLNQKKVIVAINKVDLLDKAMAKKQRMVQENVEQEGDGAGEGVNQGEIPSPQQQPFSVADAIMHWRQLLPDAIAIIPMCASKGGKDVGVVALRTLLMGGPNLTEAFQNIGGPLPGMFLPPTMSMITEEYAKQIIPVSPPLYSQDTLTDRNSR
jgi:small GTP-binding protein